MAVRCEVVEQVAPDLARRVEQRRELVALGGRAGVAGGSMSTWMRLAIASSLSSRCLAAVVASRSCT